MTSSSITELEKSIDEIKSLMLAYATDGRENDHPRIYQELYLDLDLLLEKCSYSNPNKYKTIELFWDDCGGTWAERRKLIGEIYADVLFDIGRRKRKSKDPQNWSSANDALTDGLSPIRKQWLKAKNFIYSVPPDYENSIKESINSIESCLMILKNEEKSTLGQIIKNVELDDDIRRLISSAYGMVSNKDFVRHGGTIQQQITENEARFFLEFSASAIIYIIAKQSRAE